MRVKRGKVALWPIHRLISDCYDAAIGSSCDSVGGVDSGEYAGMCPHHVTAAPIYQALRILLQT